MIGLKRWHPIFIPPMSIILKAQDLEGLAFLPSGLTYLGGSGSCLAAEGAATQAARQRLSSSRAVADRPGGRPGRPGRPGGAALGDTAHLSSIAQSVHWPHPGTRFIQDGSFTASTSPFFPWDCICFETSGALWGWSVYLIDVEWSDYNRPPVRGGGEEKS